MGKYNYDVAVPVTGYVLVAVSSDVELSEDEVIQQAMTEHITLDDIKEWNTHQQVVRGNVFYGIMNEVEVVAEYEDVG